MTYTEQLLERIVLTTIRLWDRADASPSEVVTAVDWTSKQLTPQDDLETWVSTAGARLDEDAASLNHDDGGER